MVICRQKKKCTVYGTFNAVSYIWDKAGIYLYGDRKSIGP